MDFGALMKVLSGGLAVLEGLNRLKGSDDAAGDDRLLRGMLSSDGQVEQVGKFKVTRSRVGPIEDRVKKIVKMIRVGKRDARLQEAVAKVINRKCGDTWCIAEKDYKREIIAIFKWVRSNVRYMADPRGVDTFRSPARTVFDFHGGDCDDFSSLVAAAVGMSLEAVGYETRLRVVSIKPNKPGNWSHILVMVGYPQRNPTRWIPLDASVNKPPGWYPKDMVNAHRDFPVPP